MVRFILFSVAVVLPLVMFGCSPVVYDNPLDPGSTAHRDEIISLQARGYDPWGDDDLDNIPNFVDEDWGPTHPKDKNPPVISLFGPDTVTIEKDDPYGRLAQYRDTTNTSLIKAIDPEGSPVTIAIASDNVDQFTSNSATSPYEIRYSARDTLGNTSSASRFFIVTNDPGVDTNPPLPQIGDTVIYLTLNDAFIDPGYSAYDLEDGDFVPVTVTGTVDVTTPGTYHLTYTASDSHNNTVSVVRTVIVDGGTDDDTTAPVLTLLGSDTIFLAEGQTFEDFMATFTDPGCTASDNSDGDITSNVKKSPLTPMGSLFSFIAYDVSDSHGNAAQTVRRIFKRYGESVTYPPVIVLVYGDSIIQHIANTAWKEPGFLVTDVQDGSIPNSQVTVDSSELIANIGKPGIYIIKYTVMNSLGIPGTKERSVQIIRTIDREAPVLTLLGSNPDIALLDVPYVDPGYTAIDEWDGRDYTDSVKVTSDVNYKRIGTYSIYYSVTDSFKNRRSATRIVRIVPDTMYTSLLERYNVAGFDSLPSISGTYTTFDIDAITGTGPDLAASILTEVQWTWVNKPNDKQFQFYMKYSAPPNFLTLSSVPHDFTTNKPQMTLSGSSVEGLDGKYYVVIDQKGNLVWVRTDDSFAIIFGK